MNRQKAWNLLFLSSYRKPSLKVPQPSHFIQPSQRGACLPLTFFLFIAKKLYNKTLGMMLY